MHTVDDYINMISGTLDVLESSLADLEAMIRDWKSFERFEQRNNLEALADHLRGLILQLREAIDAQDYYDRGG